MLLRGPKTPAPSGVWGDLWYSLNFAGVDFLALSAGGGALIGPTTICCSSWSSLKLGAKSRRLVRVTTQGTVAILAQGTNLGCCRHARLLLNEGVLATVSFVSFTLCTQRLLIAWHNPLYERLMVAYVEHHTKPSMTSYNIT